MIKTYGKAGGVWLGYTLDLERGLYVVVNEGGTELFASGSEQECINFCEGILDAAASMAATLRDLA